MKYFAQTRFYQFLSPFIGQIIPEHPARGFWTKLVVAFMFSRSVEGLIDLVESILESPIDETWQYYAYFGLETLRYGTWFWGLWYGLVQTINFTFSPHPQSMFSAVNVAFLLTWISVMGIIEFVNHAIEPTYTSVITASLCMAFFVSVVLPTCFGPRETDKTAPGSNV